MSDTSPLARPIPAAFPGGLPGVAEGLAATGVAALACAVADPWLSITDAALTLLLAVVLTAIRRGRTPAVAAAVVGFLALNFLFTEPRYTLVIADMQNVLTVFYFLLVAVVASDLAARARTQTEAARRRAAQAENLHNLDRALSAAAGVDDALRLLAAHAAATANGDALVLTPRDGGLEIAAAAPPTLAFDIDAGAVEAAEWAWRNRESAGAGTATAGELPWFFSPLKSAHGALGVLAARPAAEADVRRLLRAVADRGAATVERLALAADADAARLAAERERLRAALLSSLSHDLRTPLASILGAASSLQTFGEALTPQSRRELTQSVQDEAERLNRFVQNLLDMTRIGAGELKPRADWVDATDMLDQALTRAKPALGDRPACLDIDPNLPLLRGDPLLLTQAFVNLLDNAGKYAPPDQPVAISAQAQNGWATFTIADRGPGVAAADRERIFEMFFRGAGGDARPAGTGLGLAICRGVIEAHGGTVVATAGENGVGAAFVVRLPLPAVPPEIDGPEIDAPQTNKDQVRDDEAGA